MTALLKCEETGKVRHKSREDAAVLLRKLKSKGMRIYQCRYCNDWHLGKPTIERPHQ